MLVLDVDIFYDVLALQFIQQLGEFGAAFLLIATFRYFASSVCKHRPEIIASSDDIAFSLAKIDVFGKHLKKVINYTYSRIMTTVAYVLGFKRCHTHSQPITFFSSMATNRHHPLAVSKKSSRKFHSGFERK